MDVTLWTLPAQPVPKSDVTGSTFITIWAFTCVGFVVLFSLELKGWQGGKPTWREFGNIRNSTVLLAIWYMATTVDRWMHYEQHVLPYGYILFEPCAQILRIGSTIWYLWGTYKVLWSDLERRFRKGEKPGRWWLAAQVAIFFVALVAFYFIVLSIATRVVWLEFYSLNVIADVATKRNNFDMATTIFVAAFGIITIAAAIATFIVRANQNNGKWMRPRVCVLLATVVLFARSVAECVMTFFVQTTATQQSDVQLPDDIVFGLLTSLYLALMYFQAYYVSHMLDAGSEEVDSIESDIRQHIVEQLEAITGREVPLLRIILDRTHVELSTILQTGLLSSRSAMPIEEKRRVAEKYIKALRQSDGHRGERQAAEPTAQTPSTRRPRDQAGRQTAPLPSSTVYDSLRTNARQGVMRTTASAPNMRGQNHTPGASTESFQRFAPRRSDQAPSNWAWRSTLPGVQEHTTVAMRDTNIPAPPSPILPVGGQYGPPPPVAPPFSGAAAQGPPLPAPGPYSRSHPAGPSFNDRVVAMNVPVQPQPRPVYTHAAPVGNRRRFEQFEPEPTLEDNSTPHAGIGFPPPGQRIDAPDQQQPQHRQQEPQQQQPVNELVELAVATPPLRHPVLPPPGPAPMDPQIGNFLPVPGTRRSFLQQPLPMDDDPLFTPVVVTPATIFDPQGTEPVSAIEHPAFTGEPQIRQPQYGGNGQHDQVSPQPSTYFGLGPPSGYDGSTLGGGPPSAFYAGPPPGPPQGPTLAREESIGSSAQSPQNWSYQLEDIVSTSGSKRQGESERPVQQ